MRKRNQISSWLGALDPAHAADELRQAMQVADDEHASTAKRERARTLLRLFEQLKRGLEIQEQRLFTFEQALHQLLGSVPLRTMPLRAPRVLTVPAFSVDVGLTHAARAPNAWRTTHSMR